MSCGRNISRNFSKTLDKSLKTVYTVIAMKIALFLTVGVALPESGRFISRSSPARKWALYK
jgi:hypothetical protein